MRWLKWLGFLAALVLIAACFMTWVTIPSKNIIMSGVDATGTSFGKPGYMHIILAVLFILFHFIQKIWAKRSNLMVTAVNIGWAIRNYFLITACRGGECPEKNTGIYLVMICSILILVAALFPDIRLPAENRDNE